MKCLDDEKIQLFIDGELLVNREGVENHLNNCEYCRQRVDEQKQLSYELKNAFDLLIDKDVVVPPTSFNIERKPTILPFIKKVVYLASAACILLLLSFLFIKKDENNVDEFLYKQNETYTDANKTTMGQELIITAISPNGEQNEYIIE